MQLAPYDAVYLGRDRVWVQPVGRPPFEASARLVRALSTAAPAVTMEATIAAVGRAFGVPSGDLGSLRGELQRFAEADH